MPPLQAELDGWAEDRHPAEVACMLKVGSEIGRMEETTSKADLRRTPRRGKPAQSVDRLPPNAPEAEQAVLGAILLDPETAPAIIAQCVEAFTDGASVFYDLRHLTIYEACIRLWDASTQVDTITLSEELRKEDMLETCGGIAYIASLPDQVPSSANVRYYIDIVLEKFLLRTAVQIGTDIVATTYEPNEDFNSIMGKVEAGLIRLSRAKSPSGVVPIRDAMQRVSAMLEAYESNRGALTGIASGFIDLDRMTMGFQNGDMIVVAGRPSMGKTTLALNIADTVAVELNIPVGFFSLEMSIETLLLRMVCSRARVNMRNLRDGFLSERDYPKMTNAMGRLTRAPLFIDDTSSMTLLQMRTRMRRMVSLYGIRIFFIDYLQLLDSGMGRRDGRQQEVADISKGIKAIAKELNVPVVVLAQLNRDVEKDKKRKPRLSDLRESGAIEQDADVVGMLYKATDSDDDDSSERDFMDVNLLVAKQRTGPTGDVPLVFLKGLTRFENAAKVNETDYTDAPSRETQQELPE